jgi:membrane-associated phospholipid phosphatase
MDRAQKLNGTGTVKDLWPFFATAFVLWMVGAIFLLLYGYKGSFLVLNLQHTEAADLFFRHVTNLGDSLIAGSIFTLLFWRRNPALAATAIVCITVTGLTAQLFKNTVFNEWDRPQKIFEGTGLVHFFEHERANHKSMPSGHATTAFTATLAAAYLFAQKDRWAQVLLALAGGLICYSRVYVGMHFLGDVLAGGILGVALTVPLVGYLHPKLTRFFGGLTDKRVQNVSTFMTVVAWIGLLAGLWGRYKYMW